eukprot:525155_1
MTKNQLIEALESYDETHQQSKLPQSKKRKTGGNKKSKKVFKPPKVITKKAVYNSKSKAKSKNGSSNKQEIEEATHNGIRLRSNKPYFDDLLTKDHESEKRDNDEYTDDNDDTYLSTMYKVVCKQAQALQNALQISEKEFINLLSANGIKNIQSLDFILSDLNMSKMLRSALGFDIFQFSLLKTVVDKAYTNKNKNTDTTITATRTTATPEYKQENTGLNEMNGLVDFNLDMNSNNKSSDDMNNSDVAPLAPRNVFDCVPDDWDLDSYLLTDGDKSLFIAGGQLTLGYNSLKLLCIELVYLVYHELCIQKESIGWISSRKGNFIYVNLLKRSGDSTFKKRKIAVEMCAWNTTKALSIEEKYKTNNKVFMCPDMKAEMSKEINKYVEQCKMDNTKLPENRSFYKIFTECYPSTPRKQIMEIIKENEENED